MKQELIFKKDEQSFSAPVKIRENFSVDDNFEVPDMFKDLELEKGRYFWGYANISTPDSMGDKFSLDALTQISQGLTIAPYNKIFLFHNYKDIAIGQIVASMVDGFGLLILAKLNEAHQRSDETMKSIINKSLDGFSMAGNLIRVISEYDEDTGQFVNLVLEATAKEVTLTSIPTHPGASVMGTFRKSMANFQNRFLKTFKDGKDLNLKESEKYKKDKSHNNSMGDEDNKKTGEENKKPEDNSQENKGAENKTPEQIQEEKEALEKVESEKAEAEKVEAEKKAEEEKLAKEKADAEKSDEEKKAEEEAAKKKAEQEKISDADKLVSEYKEKISELEKENADLKTKLSSYEKAEKIGYEKAMKEKEDKTKEPFRKSVKTPQDAHNSNKSHSTPMLNWLKK